VFKRFLIPYEYGRVIVIIGVTAGRKHVILSYEPVLGKKRHLCPWLQCIDDSEE
jgi:hypothetical protein